MPLNIVPLLHFKVSHLSVDSLLFYLILTVAAELTSSHSRHKFTSVNAVVTVTVKDWLQDQEVGLTQLEAAVYLNPSGKRRCCHVADLVSVHRLKELNCIDLELFAKSIKLALHTEYPAQQFQ